MKLLRNTGAERVVDLIRPQVKPGNQLDLVTSTLSIFAFAELRSDLSKLVRTRLLLPAEGGDLGLTGTAADRGARNRLQSRWLARQCANWLQNKVELRRARDGVPQGAIVVRDQDGQPQQAVLGSFAFTTEGLGITPGNPLSSHSGVRNSGRKRPAQPMVRHTMDRATDRSSKHGGPH